MTREPAAPDRRPFVIGLTGGIASGKSTVSALFNELGVPIIDTDLIARQLVEPGQPLLASVVAAFGQELLDAFGRLKRKKLRDIVFGSASKRQELEAIMHPQIAEEARRQILAVTFPYCILVIPLLAEKGGFTGVDRVLVVDIDEAIQRQRLGTRDTLTEEQIDAILAAQSGREHRLTFSDDIINNCGTVDDLSANVRDLHMRYLALCSDAQSGNA